MRILLVLLLATLAACAGAGPYQPCGGDGDCASGRCDRFYPGNSSFVCLAGCATDRDCPSGLACGQLGPDDRVCAPRCDPEDYDQPGFACVDGAPVLCELAGAGNGCRTCGCPAGQRCDAAWRDVGAPTCQPKRAVGEPCLDPSECASDHCSVIGGTDRARAGFCQVPAGAACTDATCRVCGLTPAGSACARTCMTDEECGSDEACVLDLVTDTGTCLPTCGGPARCPYGWQCIPSFTDDPFCVPPTPCDVEAPTCTHCAPLTGADYGVCTSRCSPGSSDCPPDWTCEALNAGFACVPPPP